MQIETRRLHDLHEVLNGKIEEAGIDVRPDVRIEHAHAFARESRRECQPAIDSTDGNVNVRFTREPGLVISYGLPIVEVS